jgi:aspartyl/asparaginyl beta-hydroxylase (cupin superfamily)
VLARALLVKLSEESDIDPHSDSGDYLGLVRRHHIPIVTNDRVYFSVGGERKHLRAGECWEINNNRVHSVENRGGERIHLIIDIMPRDAVNE